MGVFTTAAKTWGAEALKSSDLNAQVRDFINGFGAFTTTYTPTLTGAALGTGGSSSGAYLQVGKLVIFRATFLFGTSANFSGASTLTMNLPVTASSSITSYSSLGTWSGLLSSGVASGHVLLANNTTAWFNYPVSAASGSPNTWAFLGNSSPTPNSSSTKIGMTAMYEAA